MADRIVQALEPFSAAVDGVPVIVTGGALYYASDPIVKGREHLFGDVTVLSSTAGRRSTASVTGSATETATAEPGQRRRMARKSPAEEPVVEAPPAHTPSEV